MYASHFQRDCYNGLGMKKKPLIVGIVGPSGSGKTTVGTRLKSKFPEYEHIRLDDYLKHPRFFPKKKGYINWELPRNFKFNVLVRHLNSLSKGRTVRLSKRIGNKTYTHVLKPKKYVLVEGIVLLKNKDLKNCFERKIFLDIPIEMIPKRRKKRNGKFYYPDYDLNVVIPEYLRVGHSQKKSADYVLDGTQSPDKIAEQVKRIIEAS